jgi:hypothetical protein
MTVAEAIRAAMRDLGGEVDIRAVEEWVGTNHPGLAAPGTVSTTMADLAYPGSASSTYPTEERFLVRVSRGRYRLRQQ